MITIAGAGIAGLACAYELARRNVPVTIYEAGSDPGVNTCSRFAGGMLAPWCERENAGEQVVTMGARSINWWAQITPVTRRGTLVIAPHRDRAELARFARRTTGYQPVSQPEIANLEPALEGRFSQGLYFENEAHLDPRKALLDLTSSVQAMGVRIVYATPAPPRIDLDCTGIAAPLPDLRPVRGEMALLHAPDIIITRTLRLLHPRVPLYLVPRGNGVYMIGATMVESSSARPATLRSLMELLGAAFTLHPGFAEAAVIETGAGLRPAFPDNFPRLIEQDGTLYLNGLYRHGFLLAPAMAAQAADRITSENTHEYHRQCTTS